MLGTAVKKKLGETSLALNKQRLCVLAVLLLPACTKVYLGASSSVQSTPLSVIVRFSRLPDKHCYIVGISLAKTKTYTVHRLEKPNLVTIKRFGTPGSFSP